MPDATVAPKVVKPMPVRRANAEIRPREHLTEIEVEKLTVLITAAKGNRWGQRDRSS
jgi:hypothetical protein